MLDVALAYLKAGWSVIPVHTIANGHCTCGRDDCSTPGKHPRVRWAEYTGRLPSTKEVRQWFGGEFYGSNIGLVTGAVSNIFVVDCDGPEGVDEAGNLNLPTTLTARTGGGGRHLFYRLNGATIQCHSRFLPHVDIKGDHGFVVLAPSLHKSGRLYRWVKIRPPAHCDSKIFKTVDPGFGLGVNSQGWFNDLLGGVGEGERSNAAAKLAGRYANLGLTDREVYYLLRFWNEKNSPPLTHSELKATVRAVGRKHREESIPEQVRTVSELSHLVTGLAKTGGDNE